MLDPIRKAWLVALCLLASTQASAQTTLNFVDLNPATDSAANSLAVRVDGGAASSVGLTVVGGIAGGNNYIYTITYTGADFDGDSSNDTLSLEVLVEAYSGSVVDGKTLGTTPGDSVANASATIGGTDANVVLTTGEAVTTWIVGPDRMVAGETLQFRVLNASSSVGTASFAGFDSVYGLEWGSHSHQAILGEGVDSLNGYDFNDNLAISLGSAAGPLLVSAANAGTANGDWGVGSIDFTITVEAAASGNIVNWDGSTDRNWNVASNWSSGVLPGTDPGDVVLLSGSGDDPVVPTQIETSNEVSLQVRDGALLEVCRGLLLLDDVLLGASSGLGGGHMLLMSLAEVEVAGDLRIGASPGATSDSSVEVRSGSLSVQGELYVGKGVLEIPGAQGALAVEDLTVDSGGTLLFDFDLKPSSPIQVADHFSIASGAKLEIDLRGYNTGSNELELVRFSSVSGSFDPSNISITGLGGGVVTLDGDSLNLTVIDDVAARSSTLWFVATGGDGSNAQDLQVNTGRRIRDTTSPDMSYTAAIDGNDRVYSATWSGSDFDGDGVNDTVSFDLRVEGFAGSSFAYDSATGEASMSGLGSAASVEGDGEGWGVGADGDLDAGESLRFTVENLQLSTPGGSLEGFVGAHLVEPSGGFGHVLMVGEGQDLESWSSNFALGMGFAPESPLVVTSAADSNVEVNNVAFKLVVSDLPDFLDTEVGDYSHYPTGPQHRSDYPTATDIDYPDWSWDTLQMSAGVHRNDALPDDVAQLMANTYPVISLGGRNFYGEDCVELGMAAAAAKLKFYNPDVHISVYKNAGLHHDRTCANDFYNRDWSLYDLDENGERVYDVIRLWDRYNHDHPGLREWWSDWCVDRLIDPNIDSIFIDKGVGGEAALLDHDGDIVPTTNRVKSYVSIWERLPEGDVLTGNVLRTQYFGGNRELMHIFNSSYSESWKAGNDESLIAMSDADGICASLQMFREASVKGMMVQPNHAELNHFVLSGDDAIAMIADGRTDEVIDIIRQEIQLPLAYHLIYIEAYTYFSFQVARTGAFGDTELLWNPKPYIDEFRNPLGAPLGPPQRNGYIFMRSFEHVDVWLNVETEECKLTWDWMPIADAQEVFVATDGSGAVTLTGTDPRGGSLSFEVSSQPAQGVLSGTAPNLVYTPNAGFVGEDSFTFQVRNAFGESWEQTVTLTVDVNGAPVFDSLPSSLNASVDTPFSGSLAGSASDPDGDSLQYSRVSGPSWLNVASSGALSGTPSSNDIGTNSWTVQVSDGSGGTDTATLQINVAAASLPGIVAHWALDDGSGGIASDITGNGYDGTILNATWIPGIDGSALGFDGSASSVDLPSAAFTSIGDEVTIALWANGDLANPAANSVFSAQDSNGSRLMNIHLPWGNGNVYWDAGSGGAYNRIYKAATPAEYEGAWQHWVFTKNGSSGVMNIYLNGALWHTGSGWTSSIGSVAAASLGSNIGVNSYHGALDDVQLYNVELSAAEVETLFLAYSENAYGAFAEQHDIGSPAATGTADYDSGEYTIEGSGSDIWGSSDSFNFVSTDRSGDLEIVARVASVENTNAWAKAGVMFRDSLDANAMQVSIVSRPDNQVSMQWRSATGGGSAHSGLAGGSGTAKWLRLARAGNLFTGYYSIDGSSWVLIGSQTVPLSTSAKVGLAVSSHDDGTLCTAVIDNVSLE